MPIYSLLAHHAALLEQSHVAPAAHQRARCLETTTSTTGNVVVRQYDERGRPIYVFEKTGATSFFEAVDQGNLARGSGIPGKNTVYPSMPWTFEWTDEEGGFLLTEPDGGVRQRQRPTKKGFRRTYERLTPTGPEELQVDTVEFTTQQRTWTTENQTSTRQDVVDYDGEGRAIASAGFQKSAHRSGSHLSWSRTYRYTDGLVLQTSTETDTNGLGSATTVTEQRIVIDEAGRPTSQRSVVRTEDGEVRSDTTSFSTWICPVEG